MLATLQQDAFRYFIHQSNPVNGLVRDKSLEGWPASIAAVGLALAAYPVGVERGFLTREDAAQRTLAAVLFLAVLAVVLILQNTETVTTRMLFVTIGMPLAALLALTLLIGFAGGVLVALKVGKRN